MLNPKMPVLDKLVMQQTLKDDTNIFTFRNVVNGKYGLVIDNTYDTVIRFIFNDENEAVMAATLKADNGDDYLDLLIQKYPDLKAWYPNLPASEPGDLVWIKLMNGKEITTDKAEWVVSPNQQWTIKIKEKSYSLDKIRIFQLRWPKDLLSEEFYDMPELPSLDELAEKVNKKTRKSRPSKEPKTEKMKLTH